MLLASFLINWLNSYQSNFLFLKRKSVYKYLNLLEMEMTNPIENKLKIDVFKTLIN